VTIAELVVNAAKYSSADSPIVIAAQEKDQRLLFLSITKVPSSLALLNNYYPLPNVNCIAQLTPTCSFNYENLQSISSSTNGIDARIDQIINSKQQVYTRFNWKKLVTNVVNPLLPNEEFMRFMEAEFDRLDEKNEGMLDVKELTRPPAPRIRGFHK
jgi:hypothetical protein